MKMTKKILVLVLVIMSITSLSAYSQDLDSLKIADIENRIITFKSNLKDYSQMIEKASEINTIRSLGKDLEVQSNEIVTDIKKCFNIDDQHISESIFLASLANLYPNSGSYYQSQSLIILAEGEKKKPSYYNEIQRINHYLIKIAKTDSLRKVKNLNNRIMASI